jgi:hypothetical protein
MLRPAQVLPTLRPRSQLRQQRSRLIRSCSKAKSPSIAARLIDGFPTLSLPTYDGSLSFSHIADSENK